MEAWSVWIARDEDGALYQFDAEPFKQDGAFYCQRGGDCLRLDDELFPSISEGECKTFTITATPSGETRGASVCEHGVKEGDWCPECNRAYKAAMSDPDNAAS